MEVRKIEFEKVSIKCKDDADKDYIPSNWYIPARRAWCIVAWLLIQLRNGGRIRDDKTTDKMIHEMWQFIEEYAVTVGKEIEDDTEES